MWKLIFTIATLLSFEARGAQTTISGQTFWAPIVVSGDTVITNCTFHAWDFAISGGGNLVVENCYFDSGGIFFWNSPQSLYVTHCTFNAQGMYGILVWGPQDQPNPSVSIAIACNDFVDCLCAIQLGWLQAGSNTNKEIYNNRVTQSPNYTHSDQFNIIESSGVLIMNNLLISDPNAPQVAGSTAIQAGDVNSSYVTVIGNTVINGEGAGIGAYYVNGDTDVFESNTIAGVGYDLGYSAALGVWKDAGIFLGNTLCWYNPAFKEMKPFYPVDGASTNTVYGKTQLSTAWLQDLVWTWNIAMAQAGQYIGDGIPVNQTVPEVESFLQ